MSEAPSSLPPSSSPASRRVTLTTAQRATPAGAEFVALLTDLLDDGIVTREEMARLRAWLEVDRDADFAACPFLYEVIDAIAGDGEITEDELDTLAAAVERVLPPEIRRDAAHKRKQLRIAKREALRSARLTERAAALEARERARPLHRGDFIVAGAGRSAERREACEGLEVGERVTLEREPDNRHDANAILILNGAGDELGYVPREDAAQMAPPLDAGGWVEATVKKVTEARSGYTLPIVISAIYRQGVEPSARAPRVPAQRVAADEVSIYEPVFRASDPPAASAPPLSAPSPNRKSNRARHWVLIALGLTLAVAIYLLAR